ncbi:MAG: Serine/threonine-protein kinase Pkn6 [Labilithrix sp.]|nr:Serine/threonine-protein kinase Pkn6 [Labilithrix sp.]
MMAAERGPLRVVGRYALYNEIAAGGMATVHIGRLLGPVGFARTVAVKRLHPQFAKDPEFVSMFLDEARLAARVQHPNVVATIDVVATDGELFLIMDYVRGESLSKLLRTTRKAGGHVPPRIAASIMCGFLHGLHAAHEAKNERGNRIDLVHRDVSPQNVLVGADGIPRVLDFGIAKAAGRIQVTRDGQIKGKLAYMPPEQLSGRDLTRAVDIYASAVVMWETLTGERLFKGETEGETLAKILRDPVVPPSAIVPSVPRAFDAPLLKALSRDASKRHATARELAFELEKCVGVASATEVGEWVENMVGTILSAREDQIAEIESNSASLRVSPSGRPTPDSDSESDLIGLPSSRAGTMLGVGPPSGTMPMSQAKRRIAPPTPTRPMNPVPLSDPSASGAHRPLSDENTGSKLTGSRYTGTMALPVDRRLPILASALGLIVLLVIMGVVLIGRPDNTAAITPLPSASSAPPIAPAASAGLLGGGSATGANGAAAVTSAASGATSAAVTGTTNVPDPGPSTAPADNGPIPTNPPPHTTAQVHSTGRPPAPPVTTGAKTATATPPPPPPPRRNCDPPYTLDANGRKKYKLECM